MLSYKNSKGYNYRELLFSGSFFIANEAGISRMEYA